MYSFISNFLVKIGLREEDSPKNESSPDFDEHNGRNVTRKTGTQSDFKLAKGKVFESHETITPMSTKLYPALTFKEKYPVKGKVFDGDEIIVPMSASHAGPSFKFSKGKVYNGDEIIVPMSTRSSVFEGHETIMALPSKYTTKK